MLGVSEISSQMAEGQRSRQCFAICHVVGEEGSVGGGTGSKPNWNADGKKELMMGTRAPSLLSFADENQVFLSFLGQKNDVDGPQEVLLLHVQPQIRCCSPSTAALLMVRGCMPPQKSIIFHFLYTEKDITVATLRGHLHSLVCLISFGEETFNSHVICKCVLVHKNESKGQRTGGPLG